MKDKDELALEALFRSEPIADDGFSRRVMTRVRRRIWLQRLTLPVAALIGGAIAFQPLVQLIAALGGVLGNMPVESLAMSPDSVPQLSTFILGACFVVAALFFLPALED